MKKNQKINYLCLTCKHKCKQFSHIRLINCPNYDEKDDVKKFESIYKEEATGTYRQLDLFEDMSVKTDEKTKGSRK